MSSDPIDNEANVRGVTKEELAIAFSGPAPGANKFYITVGRPGVRISFVEVPLDGVEASFRSAVTLHPADAIALYRLLRKLLEATEKEMVKIGDLDPDNGNA